MRSRLAPVAALLGSTMLAVVVGWLALSPAATAAGPERTRIVILPIVVHSASPDASHVSSGISDMISSRLEQTGRVAVERVEDPKAATTALLAALRAGQARGGDYVIFGAFTQFGDGASLDVHCLPLHVKDEAEAAAARRIFIQSGTVGEIIPKLDEIVDRVARYVKVGPVVAAGSDAPPASGGFDPAALRALTVRLEALEKAVFSGGAAGAAAGGTAAGAAGAPKPGAASDEKTAAQAPAQVPES